MINVGPHTFVPDDNVVTIGAFTLGENDDTLWVDITQDQVTGPWPWSYGILGFRSAFGYELGTVKAFSKPEGVIQRLGIGRPPLERSGVITFQPRSFNLAWIRQEIASSVLINLVLALSARPPALKSSLEQITSNGAQVFM